MFSIEREITITNEDWEKIKASKPSPLLMEIINKHKEKQQSPSLEGFAKMLKEKYGDKLG